MYPARYYLLAEYCGIPSSKRAERPVCMLRGFFDDSREDGCVLILAGYVASVEQWLSFSERWDQALTMNSPRWPAFKMRKVDLNDPFQLERAEYHYRIIEEFLPGGLCVAIPIPIFAKVVEEYNLEPKFRNPYYLAWNLVVSTFRNFHVSNGWKQTIDVYFDKQGESKMVLQAWDIISQKEGMGPFNNAPMFRDDEEIVALQAADLLAWWARKNWVEHGTFLNESWLFPWEKREPGPDYLFAEMNEDGIRQHFLNTMIFPDFLGGEAG
jgi:hypothetical protein